MVSWHPIQDLPPSLTELKNKELVSLAKVWAEQKEVLSDTNVLHQFNERIQRHWAIETGIIEHLYTLDRGITQLLIERGIHASLIPSNLTDQDPELVASLIHSHQEALDGLFDFVKGRRTLSTAYIKELHALLTREQPTSLAVDSLGRRRQVDFPRGDYRLHDVWLAGSNSHERPVAPPEQVSSEMDRLVALHIEHQESDVPPEVEAAWLHHRFTQIHPFQDGNGRVARALASLVFIREDWFPLVVTRDDRERYIDSLEEADKGDLRRLIALFSTIQKRSFTKAVSVAEHILQEDRVDQVIDAVRDLFEKRHVSERQQWERVKDTAEGLQSLAESRLEQISNRLSLELQPFHPEFDFEVDSERFGEPRDHYHRWQVIEAAQKLDYFADTNAYRSWVRLLLKTDSWAEVLVSFHGLGRGFKGLVAASVSFYRKEETDDGPRQISDYTLGSDEVFQVNYLEDVRDAEERFEGWLNQSLTRALETWRRGL